LKRYSLQAWLLASGLSLLAVAIRVQSLDMLSAALGYLGAFLLVVAPLVWFVERRAQRNAGSRGAEFDLQAARRRLYSHAGVLLLWLWNILLGLLLTPVYVEPRLNRAYTEEVGIDLGDGLLLAVASNAAVTLIVLVARGVLDGARPGRSAFVRALCLATPIALGGLAFAVDWYAPQLRSVWTEYGADLPGPALIWLYAADRGYWGVLPVLSVVLGAYAAVKADDAVRVRWAVAGLLGLLLLAGAFVTFVVFAAYLPVNPWFSFCGGAI
jgi:hypothetical protein